MVSVTRPPHSPRATKRGLPRPLAVVGHPGLRHEDRLTEAPRAGNGRMVAPSSALSLGPQHDLAVGVPTFQLTERILHPLQRIDAGDWDL